MEKKMKAKTSCICHIVQNRGNILDFTGNHEECFKRQQKLERITYAYNIKIDF